MDESHLYDTYVDIDKGIGLAETKTKGLIKGKLLVGTWTKWWTKITGLTIIKTKGLIKGKGKRAQEWKLIYELSSEGYATKELFSFSDSSLDDDDEEVSSKRKKSFRYPQFDAKTDMVDPQFMLGLLFKNASEFRSAIRQHAIKWRKQTRFYKNKKTRLRAVCRNGCD
ncbi:unnamed protein product [Ilex paraguariensis]